MRGSDRALRAALTTVVCLLCCAWAHSAGNGKATPLPTDDLMFIHHSSGQNWLDQGLNDALVAKTYIDERTDITYGTDVAPDAGRPDSLADVPGEQTDMYHWVRWFNDYLVHVKSHGCSTGVNRIIMFKSCFPISNITGDGTEPGDPFDSTQTLANYRALYRHPAGPGNTYLQDGYTYRPLEDIFAENPDTLFIPVTAPPRHYAPVDATTNAQARRARLFNNWLKNEWLAAYNAAHPGLYNVAVFDWFDVLAYADNATLHPNRLRKEYGGNSGDSHPNGLANTASTQVFATNPDNFIDAAWNAFVSGTTTTTTTQPPSTTSTTGRITTTSTRVTTSTTTGTEPSTTTTTLPMSVQVLYPSETGITLERGKLCTIRWTSSGLPRNARMAIELHSGAAQTWTLASSVPSKGRWLWNVGRWNPKKHPAYPNAADYKVEVRMLNSAVSDESDNPFAIGSPTGITVAGQTEVNEASQSQYDCTASYDFGVAQKVTAASQWKCRNPNGKPTRYATIGNGKKAGLLTTKAVPFEQPCKVIATYGRGKTAVSDDLDVTIKQVP